MRILWFSNVNLSESCKFSGSWLYSMSESLLSSNDIELTNITQSSSVKEIVKYKKGNSLTQYVLPYYSLSEGLPSLSNIKKIIDIVDKTNADLIHIWGTESYWGLLSARGYLKGPILLEIQGILSTCYNAFYGNLSPSQIFQCFSKKEILLPNRFLPVLRNNFKKKLRFESEMLLNHHNIAVQSQWVKDYVSLNNVKSCIYKSLIAVRTPFLKNEWIQKSDSTQINLVTISSIVPYKGLLDLIYAISFLKFFYPQINLYVIGSFGLASNKFFISGYEHLISKTIKELQLSENITFCGALDANGIIDIFKKCDVFIQSSYVESYSLSLAEAMTFGIPCVSTYAGAMTELGVDGESLLFYTPGDIYGCAAKVKKILDSPSLSSKLSRNSRMLGLQRNNSKDVCDNQLYIYKKILNNV